MNVRGPLPIKRIINAFGAVGYTLLLFVYAIISLSAVVWLIRRSKFFGLSINLRSADGARAVDGSAVERCVGDCHGLGTRH